jgi:hypothetical protein
MNCMVVSSGQPGARLDQMICLLQAVCVSSANAEFCADAPNQHTLLDAATQQSRKCKHQQRDAPYTAKTPHGRAPQAYKQ